MGLFKDIKILLILITVLGALMGGVWWYVHSFNTTIDNLTQRNLQLVQEALDVAVQHDLDMTTVINKNQSLESLNTGLIALGERTVTVKEYVQIYRDNPKNDTPCLSIEWMHTYNRAVEATYDGTHRF